MSGARKTGRRTPMIGKLPMKCRGHRYEFWTGVIGISDRLAIFDGDSAVARKAELTQRERQIIAARMIERWEKFAK